MAPDIWLASKTWTVIKVGFWVFLHGLTGFSRKRDMVRIEGIEDLFEELEKRDKADDGRRKIIE